MRARAVRTDQPTTPTRHGGSKRSLRVRRGRVQPARAASQTSSRRGHGLVARPAALHQKISSLNTTLGVGRTSPDAPHHRCRSAPCGPRTCATSCTVARLALSAPVWASWEASFAASACAAARRMGVWGLDLWVRRAGGRCAQWLARAAHILGTPPPRSEESRRAKPLEQEGFLLAGSE